MATITKDFNALPFEKNFNLMQGNTLLYRFQVQLALLGATAADTNLSTCTITNKVKHASSGVVLSQTITPDTAASGQCTLKYTSSQSSAWNGAYIHETTIKWPSGHADIAEGATKTFIRGTLSVKPDA